MNAVHIRTDGMYCEKCPHRIEECVEHLAGVKAARTFRDMHLTSVLYDAERIGPEEICDEIANAGFSARVVARTLTY